MRFNMSGDGKRGLLWHDGLGLEIDFDDVSTYEVALLTAKLVAILKDHWSDPKYKHLEPHEPTEAEKDDDDFWEKRHEQGEAILDALMQEGRA